MPNLSIKHVPDEMLKKLRERAERHHRSLQGELMALLSGALESPPSTSEQLVSAEPPVSGAEPPGANDAPRMRRSGTRRIEEIAAEHRQRWAKPFTQGPRAADLIRDDRDAR